MKIKWSQSQEKKLLDILLMATIINEKYRAIINVEVSPSFQVLEYLVDEDETRFVDDPPNPPQVYFYNQPHKPATEFFFSPMYEDRDGVDDKVRGNTSTVCTRYID